MQAMKRKLDGHLYKRVGAHLKSFDRLFAKILEVQYFHVKVTDQSEKWAITIHNSFESLFGSYASRVDEAVSDMSLKEPGSVLKRTALTEGGVTVEIGRDAPDQSLS